MKKQQFFFLNLKSSKPLASLPIILGKLGKLIPKPLVSSTISIIKSPFVFNVGHEKFFIDLYRFTIPIKSFSGLISVDLLIWVLQSLSFSRDSSLVSSVFVEKVQKNTF